MRLRFVDYGCYTLLPKKGCEIILRGDDKKDTKVERKHSALHLSEHTKLYNKGNVFNE